MATKKSPTGRITLRTVLQHVEHWGQTLEKRMEAWGQKLEKKIEDEIRSVRHDMKGLENRLSRQIASLDERLDDLEIREIPAIKKTIRMRS